MSDGNNKDIFKISKETNVTVTLCGRKFLIPAHFSMNDIKLYLKSLERGDSAKSALANVVYRNIQKLTTPIPTFNEVCIETDSIFESYVIAVLNSDHNLQLYFDKIDVSIPILERFAIANKQYWKENSKKIVEALRPLLKAMEPQNRNINLSLVNNYQQVLNQYDSMINGITKVVAQIGQRTEEIIAPIRNTILQFSNTFSEILANIQIPTLSEEQKHELEASYKMWGLYGWSVVPHAPTNLFNKVPTSIKEADKIVFQYLNKNGIEGLFVEMLAQSIKKEDLNAAIFCYTNKQYKACVLILFGIIDAKLIRLQPKKKNKRRDVGYKAVIKLEKKYKNEVDKEYFLYHILYFTGLIECLNTFFADGKDFREEPIVINRNFIDHGMNRRSVRRKDCIQIFLALYNLTNLLNSLL